jgi:hypothetical protein
MTIALHTFKGWQISSSGKKKHGRLLPLGDYIKKVIFLFARLQLRLNLQLHLPIPLWVINDLITILFGVSLIRAGLY